MSNLRITPITKKKKEQEELRITPIVTEEEKRQQLMSQSKVMVPAPQVTMTQNNINNQIAKNIVSGGIQNDIHNMNMIQAGKSTLDKKIDLSGKDKLGKTTPVDTSNLIYNDTGKKYGDYYYDNYELYKDMPIYEQQGKYYLKTNNGYEELGRLDKNGNVAQNVMTTKEADKEELEKAKKLGYKDNLTKITTQEYDNAQETFKKFQKEYKLSDKELNNWIRTGDFPIHVSIQTNSMTNLKQKANDYRAKMSMGAIQQYDQQGFDINKQIYMDTHNMNDEQKQQYISYITGKKDPTKKNESTFFKGSSLFDDGYQFGDVTGATLGSIGNAGYSLLKGTGKFIEGTSDFAENAIGSGLELTASDKDKKDVTTFHNNTMYTGYKYGNQNYWYDEKSKTMYDENWKRIDSFNLDRFQKRYTYLNGVAEFGRQMKEQTIPDETSQVFDEILYGNELRKASVLGNKSEAMLESLGQALPMMGAGGSVGGLYGEGAAVATTSGLTFSSTYGNAKTEALRNGATEKEAMETAFVQATAETISEQFFDAIPGAKSAGWGEKLVGKVGNGVEKYLGSKTAKIVTKTLDISGEGFEEIISNMLTAGGNDIVHYIDSDYSYGMENQTGNILEDMKNAMTSQDSMDSFISAIITSAILNGGSAKVNSAKINKIVKTYAQEYNMSIEEAKARLKISDDGIEFDTSNINQNQNTPNLPNNSVVEQRNINNNINNQTNENVQNSMSTIENNTQEKYSNVKPPMVIKYQATDNEKINSFRQSAVKEGMIDSQKTTNAMNVIEKVISDKDYNVKFDRTITNLDGKSVDGKISINKNGEVEIALNPNSDRAVEFLLTHEVTHAIETNELRGIILDYANKNSEFKSALQDLQKTYGTTNVSDEVIADISGQILGNQEFINSLSMQNTEQSRGIIKNIYHSIQRLLNKLTTKGRYRNFVEDLKTKWREAYRLATNETTVNNLKSDSKYAIANTKLDNSSFSIEKRISGDKLLDALDLIDEIKSVGAKVDENGYITLYHQTTNENANKIRETGKMSGKEYGIFFSTSENANQSAGRGTAKLEFKIPAEELILDDIFSDNADLKINSKPGEQIDVSKYLVEKKSTYRGSHQIENAKTIVDLNINEIESKVVELNGYLTNQDQRDLNKLKKMLKSPNEKVKIYRASPVNELNSGDWVTTDKSYAKNIANTNGGKVYEYEVTPSQLWYPDNVKDLPSLHRLSSFQYNNNTKYSQESSTWQEHLENNYKATGTRTYFDEITNKKIAPINHNATTNQNKVKPPIAKEYQKNTIEEKIENSSIKSINNATKIANKYLDLSKEERQLFQEKLKKYKNKTYEEISNGEVYNEIKDIVREFSIRPIENIDEEMKSVKREIRNRNIKIDDNLKNQIDDYNEFRKSMFGKLKLTKDGMSIDSLYNELSNIYPYYFDSNITTEADMLYELADFMDKNVVDIQRYNLTEKEIDDCTSKVFNEMKNGLMTDEKINSIKEKNDKKENKLTHKEVKEQLLNDMNITAEDLSVGDDIKSLNFQLTDPIRVNEKVFGRELGKKVNEVTIEKTKHNEAERTRWLNSERDDIKELEIKPRSKESAAVQKYGEKQYVNKYGETVEYGDKELMAEFPNIKTQEKIKRASQMIRNKYDKYIDQINETLTALGYDEIPKRPDYMRHFQELGDIFSQTGVPFNLNDMSAEDLPTDINGLTEFNKPGKNWFASAQKRYGNKTTYDAITGIDGYLEGASNLIFHTEDIQRYRALSGLIRDSFGKTKGFENLDNLSNKEALKRIDDIQHNKLSKYVAWLDEQANSLAGKKGAIDRGTERMLGRRGYTILNTIKKQVGSNMTGFNVRSAMTNFISSTIAASKTNKIAMVKGTVSTIRNMFHNDGFINKSDFLTTRFGSDSLSPKLWDKISNAGQILMSGSDYFTSNQIVRSKYYEGLQKGMSENEAIKYADDFGARVMGDRSKGATAEAFNSKTLGFLTQFQLETNNQWQFMVHDTKMDFQRNSKINGGMKAGATVLFQLGQLCAYSYFFNELFQSLTGSRAAFDPIDILMKLFGWGDDDDKKFEERMKEAGDELVDSIPFAGLFGNGGRMPISDALTPLGTTYDYLTDGKNSYGGDITLDDVKNDFVSTLPYYFLPTGYSQIKKTKKGLSMFSDDKEIKGSYSKSGRLRFPIKDTVGNRIKSGLFGEYASKEASEYFEQGRAPLTDKQQNMYKTLDIPISEYWTIKNDISNLKKELKGKKTEERQETIYKYIDDLDISQVRKDILKKSKYKSYKSADDKIIKYINSSKMSKKSKNEILKELKLDK